MRLRVSDIVEALRRNLGVIAMAAKELGVSRQNLEQRIRRSAALRLALAEINETSVDAAEAALLKLVLVAKDPSMIRFFLQTKGKSRGYATRTELTGKDGDPIDISRSIESLSDEQADLLERLIQAGSTSSGQS